MDYNEFRKLISSHTCNNIRNNTQALRIHNCPLPDDGSSLNTMLQKLGIVTYHHLFITDSSLATKLLTRQQFTLFMELQKLTLQMHKISRLPNDLFADTTLTNLTYLNLYTNASEMPNNLFKNLKNLVNLHICHSLESVDAGQFHNQTNLPHLALLKNKLKSTASNIFPNDASILPSETFATSININSNKFQNFPTTFFENNIHLNEFVLTKNRVDLLGLPEKLLANILQIKKVTIKCGLESLSDDVFYNSTNIRQINLDHNKLVILPDKLLDSQVNLTHLDLSHNRIKVIPPALFGKTVELKILKLAHNQLQTLERNLFKKLNKLESLDLSHNQLNTQNFNFKIELETSVNLRYLYLHNNFISDLSILHNQLPQNLNVLDLSFNKIVKLIGKNLELLHTNDLTLKLNHNHIQTIQLEDFGSYNLLDTLNVKTHLNHNPLQCDCKILESMKYLNGSISHLKFITDNLTCFGPSELEGKYLKDVGEMELLCSLEPQYVGSYKCPKECECSIRLHKSLIVNGSHTNLNKVPITKSIRKSNITGIELIVNCSHKNLTKVPIIQSIRKSNITGIELNLTMNKIAFLPSSRKDGYAECTKLFLSNNYLNEIDKTQIPLKLTHLDLRHNHLQYFEKETISFLNGSRFLQNVYLSGNKWLCDCSDRALSLSYITQSNYTKFVDGSIMICNNYTALQLVKGLNAFCYEKKIFNIIAICLSVTSIFLILALYYKYQNGIKIYLYSHNICRHIVAQADDGDNLEKTYDAFISYSHKDEEFIANHLVPELENGNPSYKLCVHVRDFIVGEYIQDQICKSIADSRRTIVVLSKNFIKSQWANMEFKEAYRATLTERRQKIIVIMYEDIGDVDNLNEEFKSYLKYNTYLKWGDPWFWQNLRYAMPHKR
ncbi:protein toll-like [Calliphora vicina]|uniref:protein toll-like n=1 Tax=Calliphora vicina TaxID=7373 RepID=UPI00325AED5A